MTPDNSIARSRSGVRNRLHNLYRKRILSPACRVLLRDNDREMSHSILVAGAPRSGTTWIAEYLETALRARLLFEPFVAQLVPQFSHMRPFHYARPEVRDDPLFAFCQSAFDGSLRSPWVDKNLTTARPRCRIVKSIRSNLMLPWIRHNFPEVPALFIIRHPCAVVLSRMHYGWTPDEDLNDLLAQTHLIEDHLSRHMNTIRAATTPEQKHAVLWCIMNLVPLQQLGYEALNPLHYECLYSETANLTPILATALQRDAATFRHGKGDRPSRTTTSQSPVKRGTNNLTHWRENLSPEVIRQILDVVAAFELDWLYDENPFPLRPGTASLCNSGFMPARPA